MAVSRAYFIANGLVPVNIGNLPEDHRQCDLCGWTYFTTNEEECPPEGPVRIVDCGHIFGLSCLTEWFAHSNTCPDIRCANRLFKAPPLVCSSRDVTKAILRIDQALAGGLINQDPRFGRSMERVKNEVPTRGRIAMSSTDTLVIRADDLIDDDIAGPVPQYTGPLHPLIAMYRAMINFTVTCIRNFEGTTALVGKLRVWVWLEADKVMKAACAPYLNLGYLSDDLEDFQSHMNAFACVYYVLMIEKAMTRAERREFEEELEDGEILED